MGIPGVQRQALEISKTNEAAFFADADFYVDGMNFAQRIAGRSDSSGTQERRNNKKNSNYHENPYARGCRLVDYQIGKLDALNPRSITFVIDAMIGLPKFRVRISRAETKLRKAEMPLHASGILAERILSHHKHIRLIYSGTEAEDEIMKLIDEDDSRKDRRQFIFSDDSDVFRFHINNPASVEVVPLVGQKLNKKKTIRTINLQAVLQTDIVPKSKRVYPPINRPGVSTINPKTSSRKFLEFINCGNVHNRFFISLGPLLISGYNSAPLDMSPFDAGHEIRRAAYGHAMETHFKDRPEVDTSKVEEWRQNGFKMEPVIVEPFQGETLRLALKVFETCPLEKIVKNQLEEVSEKYAITKREIAGAFLMVSHLKVGRFRRRPSHYVTDRTHRLFILVKAIFKSIAFLNESLNVTPEIKGMDLQVSAHHLQSYLTDQTDFKPRTPTTYLKSLSLHTETIEPKW